eukprot:NODE_1274_length_1400_cov_65.798900_g1263_i0.p4 GENE.NODE_1274_length_1400_cov_65.798900_g1263_i0~~NODE_1274_length_1400_cov_65.798900_g1263_i0.p4  ORF type:complete len:127 (-),score=9.95 NODE_1274_length_1400_cov_65.798900_g1263_i0:16-396(-)
MHQRQSKAWFQCPRFRHHVAIASSRIKRARPLKYVKRANLAVGLHSRTATLLIMDWRRFNEYCAGREASEVEKHHTEFLHKAVHAIRQHRGAVHLIDSGRVIATFNAVHATAMKVRDRKGVIVPNL